MIVDTHNHTYYSPDGSQSPKELVTAALGNGVGFLCVTEHLDNDYPKYEDESFDFLVTKKYFKEFGALREQYRDKLEILIGVEAGWTAGNENQNVTDLCKFPYEYVINSVHVVDGDDVYRPEYYRKHGKKRGYELYLDAVFQSVFAAYDYDAIGHLGYVARYADFDDNRLLYKDFASRLDDILGAVIDKKKILEINSSVGKSGSLSMPDVTVLERYYALGGRNIAFGSDSHYTPRFLHNYDAVAEAALKIGFTAWTVKREGEYVHVGIR